MLFVLNCNFLSAVIANSFFSIPLKYTCHKQFSVFFCYGLQTNIHMRSRESYLLGKMPNFILHKICYKVNVYLKSWLSCSFNCLAARGDGFRVDAARRQLAGVLLDKTGKIFEYDRCKRPKEQ